MLGKESLRSVYRTLFLKSHKRKLKLVTEAAALAQMNTEDLTISDGVLIIDILRRKAADNNRVFKLDNWTPRKLDKVLWTYGR